MSASAPPPAAAPAPVPAPAPAAPAGATQAQTDAVPVGATQAQIDAAQRQAAATNGNGKNGNGKPANGESVPLDQRVTDGMTRIGDFLAKAAAATRGEFEEVSADAKARADAMEKLDKVFQHLNAALMELGQLRSRIGSTQ